VFAIACATNAAPIATSVCNNNFKKLDLVLSVEINAITNIASKPTKNAQKTEPVKIKTINARATNKRASIPLRSSNIKKPSISKIIKIPYIYHNINK